MLAQIEKPPHSGDPRVDIARENLRIAAAKRGLNYSEISRRAGMSRNGFQQFVGGKTSLSYANLLRICDVLSVPVGVLHRPDAISDTKISLYRALERLPDHLAAKALAEAEDLLRPRP
jgi:transcriptional regulator with XRE-family HTH domain